MPGLDRTVLDQIDPQLALGRIKNDILSDFILSPHYGAIFEHVGDQLWGGLETGKKGTDLFSTRQLSPLQRWSDQLPCSRRNGFY